MYKLFICIPTYREEGKVAQLIKSISEVEDLMIEIIVVDANANDEHQIKILHSSPMIKISKIGGYEIEFWSASVNRGLKYILNKARSDDFILIANADIEFEENTIFNLLHESKKNGLCQMGALALADDKFVSSGVKQLSWVFTLTKHPYAGFFTKNYKVKSITQVDYLPGRCLMIQALAIQKYGMMLDDLLPHYGADYEFSRRLVRNGIPAFINPNARIISDNRNTGFSIHSKDIELSMRIKFLFNIKNPANLIYRSRFVMATYPRYAVPSALFFYLVRTIIETIFSHNLIKKIHSCKSFFLISNDDK
jgi:GT2 family glycosyltransferase